jgi:hypothetical protein
LVLLPLLLEQLLVEEACRKIVLVRTAVEAEGLNDCPEAVLPQMLALEIGDTDPDRLESVGPFVMAVWHTQAGVALDEECSSRILDWLLAAPVADGPSERDTAGAFPTLLRRLRGARRR